MADTYPASGRRYYRTSPSLACGRCFHRATPIFIPRNKQVNLSWKLAYMPPVSKD